MLTTKSLCIFCVLSAQCLSGKTLSLRVRVELGLPDASSGIFAAPVDDCPKYTIMPSDDALGDVISRVGTVGGVTIMMPLLRCKSYLYAL
jgi:hypothetical protein